MRQLFKICGVFTYLDRDPGARGGWGQRQTGRENNASAPCILLPPQGAQPPASGLPEVREEAQHAWAGTCPQPQPACGGEVEGSAGSGGQVVSWEAGHADLGAALAQDGELGAPIHPAAGQGRVPVFEVHGEVAVHLPAPPLALDLCLHLQEASWAVTYRQTTSPASSTQLLCPGSPLPAPSPG